MDTDLYRFGKRFLVFFNDKTDLKGENNCTHFCITWKRLNVQKATKTKGFSMILRVRVFDWSTEKVSKRNQKRSRNKTRMVCRFVAKLWLILDRVWEPKSINNQWQTKLQSDANREATRTAKEAAMRGSSASRNFGLKPWGRGRGKRFPRGFREDYLPLNHLSPKG